MRVAQEVIRPPRQDESEPEYTRSVLSVVVKDELGRLPGLALRYRGDGDQENAIPASVLGIPFYPDMAVTIGAQNLWAAEVKVLRDSGRQSALATAIGQATIYRSRYQYVSVVLIDVAPTNRSSQAALISQMGALGLSLIIRARHGKLMIAQDLT